MDSGGGAVLERRPPGERRSARWRPDATPSRRTVDGRRGSRRGTVAETCGPEPAQRRVEGGQVAVLGVVGEQREHVVVAAQDVLDEAVQGLLRAHLDEDPRARVVQRVQAADELHRRGDLPAEEVEHRLGVGVRRVEVAGHVGRRSAAPGRAGRGGATPPSAARSPGPRSRCGRRGSPGCGTALMPAALKAWTARIDRLGRTADDRLAVAVDVGDDDVAVDGGDDSLDLLSGPKTAAMAPLSSIASEAIRDPRALTASSAESKSANRRPPARRTRRGCDPSPCPGAHRSPRAAGSARGRW